MTVRLTVHRADWLAHVHEVAQAYGPGLVPVVKGNGYGLGRLVLHDLTRDLAGQVCVGSVHELADVPAELSPIVLTPSLARPTDLRPVLTVGHLDHLAPLAGWPGRVMVKLASSMRRHGVSPADLPALLAAVADAGLTVEAFAIHLPLAGDDTARLAEVHAWLPHLPPGVPLWVSHLQPQSFAALCAAQPDRQCCIRVGTALWHRAPRGPFLRLSADVLQVQPIRAGEPAGYFHSPAPHDGTLVTIGAGSAHGIVALDPAAPGQPPLSPFHFARRRLTLLEPPHMHATLVIADDSAPAPAIGDRVDVQRPLITTQADELEWL